MELFGISITLLQEEHRTKSKEQRPPASYLSSWLLVLCSILNGDTYLCGVEEWQMDEAVPSRSHGIT